MKGGEKYMKKGLIALVAVMGVVASTALIVNATDAFGLGFGMGSERRVDMQADILGIDTQELETQLEEKTFSEVLQEQGLTQEEFQAKTEEQARERMKAKGLTDEQIDEQLADRVTQMTARTEKIAELMGIDSATLENELNSSTMPELLDKYEVSHVELHNTMQDLRPESPGGGHGHGFGR
jgi:transcriptional regulator with XRE-family HTH domain